MSMGAKQRSLWLATLILVLVPIGAFGKQEQTTKDTPQQTSDKSDKKAADKKKSDQHAGAVYSKVDPSQYVGSDTCKTCHEDIAKTHERGPHWKTSFDKRHGPELQGCEACHGPGKEHADNQGAAGPGSGQGLGSGHQIPPLARRAGSPCGRCSVEPRL